MNYRYTIKVCGDPTFYENSVVFSTKTEAEAAGLDKWTKWTIADAYRVEETNDEVNYKWDENRTLTAINLEEN